MFKYLILVTALILQGIALGEGIKYGAAGWIQYGMVGNSSDTSNGAKGKLDGLPMLSSGVQLSLLSKVTPNFQIEAGAGVAAGHYLQGLLLSGGYSPMMVSPYLAQASLTLFPRPEETSGLFIRGGWFPYDYMPEAQNLGLYLLRGPVYPGFLLSGFETKAVMPVANTLGLQVHHQVGGFNHDLLLTMETEFFPYYDLSPAYVGGYSFGKAFRLGAGVNFYHLIPIDAKLTSDPSLVYVDTTGGASDSTAISFKGIKVMANAALDPKALFGGLPALGPEDLKLYGEVALIGLDGGKVYKKLYGDYMHRMPVMFGFNVPAFRLLDRLSVEAEWYGAPFKDDLTIYNHTAGNEETPIPAAALNPNERRDNWKWSVYGSRTIQNHIKWSLQVANDHFRPGLFTGYGDNAPAASESIMQSPKDWYWMTKLAYFF